MAKYLSAAWHEAARELSRALPKRPGATASIGYQVTGGPDGDVRYYLIVVDGQVVDQAIGEFDGVDLTLVSTYEDSVRIHRGELDPNAAFMQGKVKLASGANMGKLAAVMPITTSSDYRTVSERIRELTEF